MVAWFSWLWQRLLPKFNITTIMRSSPVSAINLKITTNCKTRQRIRASVQPHPQHTSATHTKVALAALAPTISQYAVLSGCQLT